MRLSGKASRWPMLVGLAMLAAIAAIAAAAVAGDIPAWNRTLAWIFSQQRAFHDAIAGELRSLAADGGGHAAATLVGLSFVYGILHAAGPGHGKAVLTAYLLTQPHQARRGVALAAAAALCQGIVAVVLIYGLILVAGWLPRDTSSAVVWSERASFALVAGLGAFLAGRGVLALFGYRHGHQQRHRHDYDHEHGHHSDEHGHSHGPTAEQMAAADSPRQFLGIVLAIGLRPCSGAVLVLVLAHVLLMPVAGILAVALMSLGTGMATAALAFLAVRLRDTAAHLAAGVRLPGAAMLGNTVTLAGGVLLLALGASLLSGSFAPAHPFRV